MCIYRNDDLYEEPTTTTQAPRIIFVDPDRRIRPNRPKLKLKPIKLNTPNRPQRTRQPSRPSNDYYDQLDYIYEDTYPDYSYTDYAEYDYDYDYRPVRQQFRPNRRQNQRPRGRRPGGVFSVENRQKPRINPPVPLNDPRSAPRNRKPGGPVRRRKTTTTSTTTTPAPSDYYDYYDYYDYDTGVDQSPSSTTTTTTTTTTEKAPAPIKPERRRRPGNRRPQAERPASIRNEVSIPQKTGPQLADQEQEQSNPQNIRSQRKPIIRRTRPQKNNELNIPEDTSNQRRSQNLRPNRVVVRQRQNPFSPIDENKELEVPPIINEVIGEENPLSEGSQGPDSRFPKIIVEEPPLAPGIALENLEESQQPRRRAFRRRFGQADERPVVRERRPLRRSRVRINSETN